MRKILAGLVVLAFVSMLSAVAAAGDNPPGTANTYKVNFAEKVRVADKLLPAGDYEIRHVMEGAEHIMVFRQLKTRNPIEVRAKCTLVPLTEKADKDQKVYVLNAADERVLQELTFKGDQVKHVF